VVAICVGGGRLSVSTIALRLVRTPSAVKGCNTLLFSVLETLHLTKLRGRQAGDFCLPEGVALSEFRLSRRDGLRVLPFPAEQSADAFWSRGLDVAWLLSGSQECRWR